MTTTQHLFQVTFDSDVDAASIERALREHGIEAKIVGDDLAAALKWITSHDTCAASISMWCTLQRVPLPQGYASVPINDADFGRCYRMLRSIPGWRERIGEVHDVDGWSSLIEDWGELERLYEQIDSTRNYAEEIEARRRLCRRLRECAWRGSRLEP